MFQTQWIPLGKSMNTWNVLVWFSQNLALSHPPTQPESYMASAETTCGWHWTWPRLSCIHGVPDSSENPSSWQGSLFQLLVKAPCGPWVEVELKLKKGELAICLLRSVWLSGLKNRHYHGLHVILRTLSPTGFLGLAQGHPAYMELALESRPANSTAHGTHLWHTVPTASSGELGELTRRLLGLVNHVHSLCLSTQNELGTADSCPFVWILQFILSCSLPQITTKNVSEWVSILLMPVVWRKGLLVCFGEGKLIPWIGNTLMTPVK